MANCNKNSFTYTYKLDNSKSSVEAWTVLEVRSFTPFFLCDDMCIKLHTSSVLYRKKNVKLSKYLYVG